MKGTVETKALGCTADQFSNFICTSQGYGNSNNDQAFIHFSTKLGQIRVSFFLVMFSVF